LQRYWNQSGETLRPPLLSRALAAMEDGDDPVLVVTPADRTVANPEAFTLEFNML
jgi:mannose-1-phosphate guanylyltransferase/mannose-6-phosphate isomerase